MHLRHVFPFHVMIRVSHRSHRRLRLCAIARGVASLIKGALACDSEGAAGENSTALLGIGAA